MDAFRFNLLMLVGVMAKVKAIHHGFCRSAGSVGFAVYEELVALRYLVTVFCCAEVNEHSALGMPNPMHAPFGDTYLCSKVRAKKTITHKVVCQSCVPTSVPTRWDIANKNVKYSTSGDPPYPQRCPEETFPASVRPRWSSLGSNR